MKDFDKDDQNQTKDKSITLGSEAGIFSRAEHPKMPDPQCIKTYYQTTMMPKVPQSRLFFYGHTAK